MSKKTKLLISIFFIFLLFSGCSSQPSQNLKATPTSLAQSFEIEDKISGVIPNDLKHYPQDASHYIDNIPDFKVPKSQLIKEFKEVYFLPWKMKSMRIDRKQATWGYAYKNMKMYGENYQRKDSLWFKEQIDNSNMDAFDTIKQKAITIKNSSLRVFPSHKPMFKNYQSAGEGFPFDYNQNTSIKINAPLYISHYSKDKAWVYVSSSFAAGWIPLLDIALVDEKLADKFLEADALYVTIKDKTPIYKNGFFREYTYIGTIFPYRKNKLATVIRDNTGKGYLSTIDTNHNIVPFPLPFNEKNISYVINEMIGQKYGWGGLYNNRDCSLLTKDYFTVFGQAIERNSFGQTKSGTYISAKEFTDNEKLTLIKQKGIPFLTLIYIKGHIGLYLGTYKGTPLMFHSTWGIKTLDEQNDNGRIIVGKSVISSLELGKEFNIYDETNNYLHHMRGIVLLNN
jgi:cell wall-associated NlpC family hydrolase